MAVQFKEAEWKKNVRAALKNWQRLDKLNQNPLTEMDIVSRQVETSSYINDPYKKALALREVMRSAIVTLGVEGEKPPDQDDLRWLDEAWRPYLILTLLQRHKTATVADMLLMAGGNYYEVQGESIELLVEILRGREGIPSAAASPITLSYPSGAVKITDRFYIERIADMKLKMALSNPGQTITIQGSRQVGKTSLLVRGMHEAQQRYGAHVVYFDLQGVGGEALNSLDTFLRAIADWTFDDLGLDLGIVHEAWKSSLSAQRKLTKLFEHEILAQVKAPVLLAMDEIDRLQLTPFHSDFFSLIRSWHNMRASRPQWEKLNIIMSISTEPYLLIDDLQQSPFNVGRLLYVEDFDKTQVVELSRRYGTPLPETDLLQLVKLLNGHPFLTRVAFYTMVVENLSWSDFETMAPSDQGPFSQHLQHQYRLLLRDPVLQQALKEIVHGVDCSDDKAGFRLMKAGLVIKEGDRYICRCELYQRYFADKL